MPTISSISGSPRKACSSPVPEFPLAPTIAILIAAPIRVARPGVEAHPIRAPDPGPADEGGPRGCGHAPQSLGVMSRDVVSRHGAELVLG
ncbi:hypothetical protein GCM10010921_05240 [Microbacterium album]|uniref:Uncharacterized protein n=1 Tax=Microbacterium album TaxID=2053191 RepID=A0A917IBV4_9MICO|nr:hypothetical protein GCM10010921_05240 [Microbacterium album]